MHAYLSVCAWGLLEGQKTNEWNHKGYLVEGGHAHLGVGVRICSGARISSRYVLKYFFEFGVMNVSPICKVNKIKEQADPDQEMLLAGNTLVGSCHEGAIQQQEEACHTPEKLASSETLQGQSQPQQQKTQHRFAE